MGDHQNTALHNSKGIYSYSMVMLTKLSLANNLIVARQLYISMIQLYPYVSSSQLTKSQEFPCSQTKHYYITIASQPAGDISNFLSYLLSMNYSFVEGNAQLHSKSFCFQSQLANQLYSFAYSSRSQLNCLHKPWIVYSLYQYGEYTIYA